MMKKKGMLALAVCLASTVLWGAGTHIIRAEAPQSAAQSGPVVTLKAEPGKDNTARLTDAIKSTPDNGTLVLSPGVYEYSHILVEKSNITIAGSGATLRSTMKVEEGGASGYNIFQIMGNNITLSGIRFELNHTVNYDKDYKPENYANGHHIRIGSDKRHSYYAQNLTIENCTIDGGYGGAIDIWYGENVRIKGNTISNTLGNGIFSSSARSNLFIENNVISNTRDDGVFIASDKSLPEGTKNVRIAGNTITNTYAKGIGTSGVDGAVIEGNTIDNTWAAGIQPFRDTYYNLNTSKNVVVRDNLIKNGGRNFGPGKYKTVQSNNRDGIYISGKVSDIIVEGNHVVSPVRYGVAITAGNSRITVKDNNFEDIPNYCVNAGDVRDATQSSGSYISVLGNTMECRYGGVSIGGVTNSVSGPNEVTVTR